MDRAWGLLLVLLLCLVMGLATGLPLFYRLVYALALLLAGSALWSFLALRWLEVQVRRSATRVQVGDRLEERITVRNLGFLPKPWMEVEDLATLPGHRSGAVVNLPRRGFRSWKVETVAGKRGIFQMGPIRAVSGDPFGLFRMKRLFANAQELIVYPRTVPLPFFRIPATDLPGEGPLRHRALQVTPHAASVREFQPGDSLNRIHWPTTARVGRLMVKEFDLGLGSAIWLCLDLQRGVQAGQGLESTEEYGVSVAASLGRHYLEAQWLVGLVGYGDRRYFVEVERGLGHLHRLLEHLAMAQGQGDTPLVEVLIREGNRFSRYATLVVVTPSLEPGWVSALEFLSRRGVHPVAVLVDPTSFGGDGDAGPLLERLRAAGVLTYIVRRGDDLARALAHPVVACPEEVLV